MMTRHTPVVLRDGSIGNLVTVTIPHGDQGIRTTLDRMRMLAIRDASDERVTRIVRRHKKSSHSATARALFDYMVSNYRYHSDPTDREHVTAPVHILTKNSPFPYLDCDDLSAAYSALLTAAGIPNALKVIAWRKTDPPNQYTHVYNEYYDGTDWRPVDLVMRKDGWHNERNPINRWERLVVLEPSEHMADNAPIVYADVDYEAIGKDLVTRALPKPFGGGENVGDVLKQHVISICLANVRQQLYFHRWRLAGAGAAIGLAFFAGGYAAGRSVSKKRRGA